MNNTIRYLWQCGLIGVIGMMCVAGADAAESRPFEWSLPMGFPIPRVPEQNPMSWEKIELGRILFYDTRLSGNNTQSCASCHAQEAAFTDGLARAVGSTGEMHPRSSMSLANIAYSSTLGWANPLLGTLEQQALVPMFGENPVELGLAGREEELFERLRTDTRYRRMFREAFPDAEEPVSLATITWALAAFERTLISGTSPFDRYVFGLDDDALSPSAIRGGELFFSEQLECFHCHGGFNFSDSVTHDGTPFVESNFHNNGLYNIDGAGAYPPDNTGLLEITGDPDDMGRFKAPTLRNIELTAPYMHDGSIATLEEVLDHYAAGGRTIVDGPFAGDGSSSPLKGNFVAGFTLSAQEKADVLNFLRSLTDTEFIADPRFRDPFTAVACAGDCDRDGAVTIDELLSSVNVALGELTFASCLPGDANGDGDISVDELIRAMSRALAGCPHSTN